MTTSGVTQTFVYGRGQRSTLGIGESRTGAPGSWRQGGTETIASTSSVAFPSSGEGNDLYRTQFYVGKFELSCPGIPAVFELRAYRFAGGASVVHPAAAPAARFCIRMPRGAVFTLTGSTAVSWSNGFTIPSQHFSTVAQTGYAKTAAPEFHFAAKNKLLCGTNGLPTGKPRQLVAKS